MADLGCQDTVWIGGNDKEVVLAILQQDWLILATLSMDKGECGYLGFVFGWVGALMVDLGCQDTDWVGGNDKDISDVILLQDGLILHKGLFHYSSYNKECYSNCNMA